jgi:hypothetical protein
MWGRMAARDKVCGVGPRPAAGSQPAGPARACGAALWGRLAACAAVANRRRPIDNRPQLNKLPYITEDWPN